MNRRGGFHDQQANLFRHMLWRHIVAKWFIYCDFAGSPVERSNQCDGGCAVGIESTIYGRCAAQRGSSECHSGTGRPVCLAGVYCLELARSATRRRRWATRSGFDYFSVRRPDLFRANSLGDIPRQGRNLSRRGKSARLSWCRL
jgi:hypothetical protein